MRSDLGGKALLIESVDFFRLDANRKLDPERRSALGQFMTPPATALLMASMFQAKHDSIRLLDAGAGVGSLTAAFIEEMCGRSIKPRRICATAYEIDPGSRLISLTRCVNAKGLARTLASNLNPS